MAARGATRADLRVARVAVHKVTAGLKVTAVPCARPADDPLVRASARDNDVT